MRVNPHRWSEGDVAVFIIGAAVLLSQIWHCVGGVYP